MSNNNNNNIGMYRTALHALAVKKSYGTLEVYYCTSKALEFKTSGLGSRI